MILGALFMHRTANFRLEKSTRKTKDKPFVFGVK